MKKIFIAAMLMIMALASIASAQVKALPANAFITATCDEGNIATLTIAGVKGEIFELYGYDQPPGFISMVNLESVGVNLNIGRRFNFTFDGGNYALLYKEMLDGLPPAFLGNNVWIDFSDKNGAAFIITCPSSKK